MSFKPMEVPDDRCIRWGRDGVHELDEPSRLAVEAARASGRPLLVRGLPGTGKSQLARAVAEALGHAFISKVIDARTEARDLLYTFDAVKRLADAQLATVRVTAGEERATVLAELDEARYLVPGPLWWAFDWNDAATNLPLAKGREPYRPKGEESRGAVVLIDEIDKADSDLPNGLLEALGALQFPVAGRGEPVCADLDLRPVLVVVTTNEERALPDAFIRRCVVLNLELDEDDLMTLLTRRGAVHFPKLDASVLKKAAELLLVARPKVRDAGHVPPGQAEYLDLLRAIVVWKGDDDAVAQIELLEQLSEFTYLKHPPERDAR